MCNIEGECMKGKICALVIIMLWHWEADSPWIVVDQSVVGKH